jgi:hypothetical protein
MLEEPTSAVHPLVQIETPTEQAESLQETRA